jgi:hypothetical protein
MADGAHIGTTDRRQQPLVDLRSRLLQTIVQHGQHPVGFAEHVVGQVECRVLEDVALDAA